ncbi:MAG: winged helix-turn-helix transcriptional regulator [Candidatus Omnitrophica bacterium]|nr:winged helix-turn-helix transcriptional regulator [Candidatus Omnitrophota bacterium]
MFEELFTSKIRLKLLQLFLSDPAKPRYLRGLERELGEPLSPLRRELVKLVRLGLLTTQREANIKYYYVNKQSELFHRLYEFFQKEPRELTEENLIIQTVQHTPVIDRARDSEEMPQPEQTTVSSTVSSSTVRLVDGLLLFIFLMACINIYLVTNVRITPTETKSVFYPLVHTVAAPSQEVAKYAGSSLRGEEQIAGGLTSPETGRDMAAYQPMPVSSQQKDEAVAGEQKTGPEAAERRLAKKTEIERQVMTRQANQMSSPKWRMSFGTWHAGTTIWHPENPREPEEHEL